MFVDISNICNSNNLPFAPFMQEKIGGNHCSPRKSSRALHDSMRVMRDGLNALIVELPRAVDRTADQTKARLGELRIYYETICAFDTIGWRINSRIYIDRV